MSGRDSDIYNTSDEATKRASHTGRADSSPFEPISLVEQKAEEFPHASLILEAVVLTD